MTTIFHNEKFINEDQLKIKSSNRAFNYADGFFESIKVINSNLFNFSIHYSRYQLSCDILKINIAKTEEELFNILTELIKKNKIIHGNVKIHISRAGKGKYLPDSCNSEILIKTNHGSIFKNNKAISICIFSGQLKSKNSLSNIKSINCLVSILASIYANNFGFDNALLKNSEENIIEATNSNIFILKNNVLYTPPIHDGAVLGSMRQWILEKENVIEKSLSETDIIQAEEVFITNSIKGIIPVKLVNIESDYIYRTKLSKILQQRLINLS